MTCTKQGSLSTSSRQPWLNQRKCLNAMAHRPSELKTDAREKRGCERRIVRIHATRVRFRGDVCSVKPIEASDKLPLQPQRRSEYHQTRSEREDDLAEIVRFAQEVDELRKRVGDRSPKPGLLLVGDRVHA
jgi:hypothetical protein